MEEDSPGTKRAKKMTHASLVATVLSRTGNPLQHKMAECNANRPSCSVCSLIAREWIEKPTSSEKKEAERVKAVLTRLGFKRRDEVSQQRRANFKCSTCNINFCDFRCYNMYHGLDHDGAY